MDLLTWVGARDTCVSKKNKRRIQIFDFQGSSDEADDCTLPDRRPHTMPQNDQHTGMSPIEGEANRDNILG